MLYNASMALFKENPIVLNISLSEAEVYDVARHLGADTNIVGDHTSLKISRHSDDTAKDRDYFIMDSINGKTFRAIVRGDIGDDELVAALSRLPKRYKPFIDEVRRIFNLPEFDARHQQLREAEDRHNAKQLENVAAMQSKFPKRISNDELSLEPESFVEVRQSLMQVLGDNDKQQFLVTEGVTSCVAVMLINPKNHRIGLAHIASANDIRLLEDMRQQVQGDSGDPVEVKLWGGRPDRSERLVAVILDEIEQMKGLGITSMDVCDPERKGTTLNAIALSRDGDIRITTTEVMSELTAPPPLGFELTDEHIDRMLTSIRGVEPTSIKPDRDAMKRKDIGRGRGKVEDSEGEGGSSASDAV